METPGTPCRASARANASPATRLRGESFLGQRSRRTYLPHRVRGGQAKVGGFIAQEWFESGTASRAAGPIAEIVLSAAQRISGSSCVSRPFNVGNAARPGTAAASMRQGSPARAGHPATTVARSAREGKARCPPSTVERDGRAPALLRRTEANASLIAGNAVAPRPPSACRLAGDGEVLIAQPPDQLPRRPTSSKPGWNRPRRGPSRSRRSPGSHSVSQRQTSHTRRSATELDRHPHQEGAAEQKQETPRSRACYRVAGPAIADDEQAREQDRVRTRARSAPRRTAGTESRPVRSKSRPARSSRRRP